MSQSSHEGKVEIATLDRVKSAQSAKVHLIITSDDFDQDSLKPGLLPIPVNVREKIRAFVNNLFLQIFLFMLVLVDLSMLIVTMVKGNDTSPAIYAIVVTIILILAGEVFLRLLYMDPVPFFRNVWCMFDLIIVILCIIFEIALVADMRSQQKVATTVLVALRVIRSMRVIKNILRFKNKLKQSARGMVGGARRRYMQDGFDIDLTYVTEKLLAMSVPAVGTEAFYRNPVDDVAKFFETKYKDNYRFYNCCPERKYPYEKFQNRVEEYFMEDHNPTPIFEIVKFCHHVKNWLSEGKHVAAVHCKGGKGRTGTMVCSYLLFSRYVGKDGVIKTPEASIAHFASRRSSNIDDQEGVEARSQKRYIAYMAKLLQEYEDNGTPFSELIEPKGPTRTILRIRVHGIAKIKHLFDTPWFQVSKGLHGEQYTGHRYNCQVNHDLHTGEEYDYCDFIPFEPIDVQNDVKIAFWIEADKKHPLFGYWWHTYFEEGEEVKEEAYPGEGSCRVLKLDYPVVDGIRHALKKEKYKNSFPKYFQCQTFFR